MYTSNEFLVNFDFIFEELKLFIPSNPSVKYNFINLSFEVSKAYLLIVVNDSFNFAESKSDFWDSLEKKKGLFGNKDEDGAPALDKNKDPNQSLMEMMRDMYQNGDPEMKRMIAEAWTKSRDEQESKHKHEH